MSILSRAKKLVALDQKKEVVEKKPRRKAVVAKGRAKVGPKGQGIELIPWLTEKSVKQQERQIAVFRVEERVTKGQVALAVQARFGMRPQNVRLVRLRGKKRQRGNIVGQTNSWKKAYVKVADVSKLIAKP